RAQHLLVVLLKIVTLNYANKLFRISRIGSVTRFSKAFGPAHIIVFSQFKKILVTAALGQKQRVITKRIFRIGVLSKTFPPFVIVVIYSITFPSRMAFYAKMIVGFHSEFSRTSAAFQNSLG